MSDNFLDRDVPRFTWRAVMLWVALSPIAAVAVFFIVRAEAAAAWVQAVGSILAILAAVWIARQADRRADSERLQSQEVCLAVAAKIAKDISRTAKGFQLVLKVIAENGNWSQASDGLRTLLGKAEAFDATRFANAETATAFLELISHLRDLMASIRYYEANGKDNWTLPTVANEIDVLVLTVQRFLEISLHR
jgi:uncharacterized membrane protein